MQYLGGGLQSHRQGTPLADKMACLKQHTYCAELECQFTGEHIAS